MFLTMIQHDFHWVGSPPHASQPPTLTQGDAPCQLQESKSFALEKFGIYNKLHTFLQIFYI